VQQKEHLEEIVSERTDEILKKNEELKQQKEEISATLEVVSLQKKEIEDAQKQTNASISYAQRIQNAVLPNQKFIDTLLKEHFIFFKPRDIVSGDFYFIKQINDYFLIAAADCTGHGVPGAFMSMLGIAILNEITQKTEIMHSNQILNDLRRQIKNSLNQTGKIGEQQDGMDIAFCAINTTTLEMSFAGAYNPCWIFRTTNNETNLIELAADRMPVGIHIKEKDFSEQIFQLQKGDVFYIFSDGYYSQFGGAANNKYKTKRLREFLQTNYHKSLSEQKEAIENEFNTWKGSNLQTDDVLVIGVGV
jgi:serine phosphatase RsbU (regulator of sigma subunit)